MCTKALGLEKKWYYPDDIYNSNFGKEHELPTSCKEENDFALMRVAVSISWLGNPSTLPTTRPQVQRRCGQNHFHRLWFSLTTWNNSTFSISFMILSTPPCSATSSSCTSMRYMGPGITLQEEELEEASFQVLNSLDEVCCRDAYTSETRTLWFNFPALS